jgi:hypothetical protein
VNTLALTILSALALLVLFGSRRWATLGMLGGILYLTQGMALNVAGFSLYPTRVLLLVVILRIVVKREYSSLNFNQIDKVFVWLYVYSVGVFLLRSNEGQVFQVGVTIDALLAYFAFRVLVQTIDDLRWLLCGLVALLLPYALLVWIESLTLSNPFSAVGGAENATAGDMWIREGRLRATGSFGHPSLLGTVGATYFAVYIGLLFEGKCRLNALLGIVLCLAIVGASNSGGPATGVAVALAGWLAWRVRTEMQWLRRFLLALIALLAMVMEAPIWYLLAKVSQITGGAGWHRSELMNVAFQNLDRWWFAGMPLSETSGWLPYTNTLTGNVDMTNTYLQFGVNSGLGAVILLLALLTVAFSRLGRSMGVIRSNQTHWGGVEPLYWGLGVMLTVHLFNWFAITYWDQTNIMWFLQLAILGSLTSYVIDAQSATAVAQGGSSAANQ